MSQAPLRFALLKVLTRREYEEKAIQEMQELEALVHTFGGVVVERSWSALSPRTITLASESTHQSLG